MAYEDLKRIIADWKDGKEIRVLSLGHSASVRQGLVYEHAFRFMEIAIDDPTKHSFEKLQTFVDSLRELNEEERGAVLTFAWLALRNGWNRAIAGHLDHKYTMITREAKPA